jgi:hypothetical protein
MVSGSFYSRINIEEWCYKCIIHNIQYGIPVLGNGDWYGGGIQHGL